MAPNLAPIFQSGPASRVVLAALAWAAWLLAGAFAFDLTEFVHQQGTLLAAFAAASPQVKATVAAWLLGSIVLCTLLLMAIQKLIGSRRRN